MNVSHSNIDQMNAVISIEIEKADYADRVKKSLRAYGERANIPGFRRGKAPVAMLKSKYASDIEGELKRRLLYTAFDKINEVRVRHD